MKINKPFLNEAKWNNYSFLEHLIIIFTFFPYITLIPFPSDTQPYCLLLSCLYILVKFDDLKIRKFFVLFLFVFFFSLIIFISKSNAWAFRSVTGFPIYLRRKELFLLDLLQNRVLYGVGLHY